MFVFLAYFLNFILGTSDEENESETQKLPEYSTSDSEGESS